MCASHSRKFQFLFAFLIFINLLTLSLGQDKKCEDFGGYCLNHWDCCSNICMNYLYKCTRPRPTVSQMAPITFQELMESHFGKPTEGGNELEEPKEFQSRFGEPLLEEGQLHSSEEAAASTTTTEPVVATETITNNPQTEAVSTVSPATANCSEIGAKCYRHSECCSQRCHGFLHQCVT